MNAVEKIAPIVTILTNRGDKKPHEGQNVTIKDTKLITLAPVAMGIIFGQYISHGTLIFAINGNQIAKYKKMPKTVDNEMIATLRAHLTKKRNYLKIRKNKRYKRINRDIMYLFVFEESARISNT